MKGYVNKIGLISLILLGFISLSWAIMKINTMKMTYTRKEKRILKKQTGHMADYSIVYFDDDGHLKEVIYYLKDKPVFKYIPRNIKNVGKEATFDFKE